MIIETKAFNQLVFDAFTGQTTWLEASGRYPLDDLIDTFRGLRAAMRRLLDDLTDAQAAHHDPSAPIWSISETITHLVYSQNGYHNQLLDITASALPHLAEAARGFGEGAQQERPAESLRQMLDEATTRIELAFAQTRAHFDPVRVVETPLFGRANYATWILLMAGHELDHFRQSSVMRRLARSAHPR